MAKPRRAVSAQPERFFKTTKIYVTYTENTNVRRMPAVTASPRTVCFPASRGGPLLPFLSVDYFPKPRGEDSEGVPGLFRKGRFLRARTHPRNAFSPRVGFWSHCQGSFSQGVSNEGHVLLLFWPQDPVEVEPTIRSGGQDCHDSVNN